MYGQLNQKVLDLIDNRTDLRPRSFFRNSIALDFYTPKNFWYDLVVESGGNYLDYLFKAWLRGERKDDGLRDRVLKVAEQMRLDLVRRNGMWTYVTVMRPNGTQENKMAHSNCYSGGLFALIGTAIGEPFQSMYLTLGEQITATCYNFYETSANKLPPTLFQFDGPGPGDAKPCNLTDQGYHLTSSTVESIMILWRLTHNEKYRRWGRAISDTIAKLPISQNGTYDGSVEVASKGVITTDGQLHADYFVAETTKVFTVPRGFFFFFLLVGG